MKAPDKIYIHEASAPELAEPVLKEYHIEYIRKEALLEWVRKEMKEWSSESTTAQGVKMGLTLVIDKIESL